MKSKAARVLYVLAGSVAVMLAWRLLYWGVWHSQSFDSLTDSLLVSLLAALFLGILILPFEVPGIGWSRNIGLAIGAAGGSILGVVQNESIYGALVGAPLGFIFAAFVWTYYEKWAD